MKRSSDRILTTHVGSLIRPQPLQAFVRAKQAVKTFDRDGYETCLSESVAEIVRRQAETGIDVVSDGEFGKSISWSQYALERLSNFERRPLTAGANPFQRGTDRSRFAEFYAELDAREEIATSADAGCVGPPASFGDYRKWVARHVEVLNHAIEGLPADRMRYHVCWGSWPGPHTTDVPLKDIVDLILKVKVGAYVIEGANPRHAHEWKVWQDVKLPEGKVLIPRVISHATNVVEHPELIAQRIIRYASLVGRENVLAGTDCGFAQGPFYRRMPPSPSLGDCRPRAAESSPRSDGCWALSGRYHAQYDGP